jgi:CRP/FNR family transcriptional regulator, cyclic AMP receptor protein
VAEATTRLFGRIPLFAGIEDHGLDAIARVFQTVSFPVAASLVRQGQPADGAYIIESGAAEVITALPGGGEVAVAALGAGSVLGEMALLESGIRSATVIARAPVAAHFIERDTFRMLLSQRNRAAFAIQNRITLTLCQRLRELNAKVVAHDNPEKAPPPISVQPAGDSERPGPATGFDWRAFLPVLPLFRRYSAADLDAFAAAVRAMDLPRGRPLFAQGGASESCYVVVRGAIEVTGSHSGQRHRIGILGPGRLCGILAIIEGQSHSMSAAAREDSVVLEIGRAAFERLFKGDDRIAARFQEVVNQELLQSLARTNNHLTRLVSQARIRGGGRERRQAEELQRALGGLECRPGSP